MKPKRIRLSENDLRIIEGHSKKNLSEGISEFNINSGSKEEKTGKTEISFPVNEDKK